MSLCTSCFSLLPLVKVCHSCHVPVQCFMLSCPHFLFYFALTFFLLFNYLTSCREWFSPVTCYLPSPDCSQLCPLTLSQAPESFETCWLTSWSVRDTSAHYRQLMINSKQMIFFLCFLLTTPAAVENPGRGGESERLHFFILVFLSYPPQHSRARGRMDYRVSPGREGEDMNETWAPVRYRQTDRQT